VDGAVSRSWALSVFPSSLGGAAFIEGNGEEITMQASDEPSAISDREAADVTRRHEEARQRAAQDVAERNRKAHEAAVKSRKGRDALREDLKRGLSF
jgi:hypothetical protein